MNIPLNKPYVSGSEQANLTELLTSGEISGDGKYTRLCCQFLQERFGIPRVLLTPSCTAALEMAAILCEFEPGDEVIMPSFTFVSTANAFVREGAIPVFADIRPDTLNLDETKVEALVTDRTKAIVAVHYGGVSCEMDQLMEIAQRHQLIVIEDAAQAVHAYYKGRALGSIGHLGCYSFHDTKNYVCGEGGALCINDLRFEDRAEILRDKGTNRQKFFQGQVDKYTWVDVGSSYVPSELSSAFLYGQFQSLDFIAERRYEIACNYRRMLAPYVERGLIEVGQVPEDCESNHHLFYILLPSRSIRDDLLKRLKNVGIGAAFHYIPLHNSPMGMQVQPIVADLPITEDASGRLLRLPMFVELTEDEQQYVVDHLAACLQREPAETAGPPLSSSI
ncbi:dTDP-4-amino-4,6-dideoxygalactose transaminase [Bremerella volcania]|uniref:dTDP-4-amino-4,6-dideoxygalactose transaminase n=1 Tax=Bremerella volcania TaxID=2527984 RepID=A0A518C864_9BACT|nr:dTDP-4-amino-4,6-dideoxygalactose transaminase [Bremerella volcania]QDU75409.1 dTDP-4-amino-4,6-dideoxygalactose transaminase [Bremerella volcania]